MQVYVYCVPTENILSSIIYNEDSKPLYLKQKIKVDKLFKIKRKKQEVHGSKYILCTFMYNAFMYANDAVQKTELKKK